MSSTKVPHPSSSTELLTSSKKRWYRPATDGTSPLSVKVFSSNNNCLTVSGNSGGRRFFLQTSWILYQSPFVMTWPRPSISSLPRSRRQFPCLMAEEIAALTSQHNSMTQGSITSHSVPGHGATETTVATSRNEHASTKHQPLSSYGAPWKAGGTWRWSLGCAHATQWQVRIVKYSESRCNRFTPRTTTRLSC